MTTPARTRLLLPQPARTGLRWGLEHGVARVIFRRQARQGNPTAQLSVDPALLADPTPVWAQIRARGPWVAGDYASWTASHAVTSAVLRSDTFGVPLAQGTGNRRVDRLLDAAHDPWSAGPIDPPSLLALDPPEHTRLRKLMSRAFTVRRVASLSPRIEETADALLSAMATVPGRRGDLIQTYAAQLPLAVIADLLGVPDRDRSPLLDWGNGAALLLDAALPWRDYRRAIRAVRELHRWMADHLAALVQNPGDDLLSQLVHDARDLPAEERPTDDELRMLGMLVLGAGFETTVNLLGNAVTQLDTHPEQRQLLLDDRDPAAWQRAVEEVLRFDSPVQFTARRVRKDLDLKALPGLADLPGLPASVTRGQVVVMMIGAANRDPAVFTEPDRFDVRRPNATDHLAFSAGAHFCLGAGLARAEGSIGLRMLYERFPDLAVVGTPQRRNTRVLRGYDVVPVSW